MSKKRKLKILGIYKIAENDFAVFFVMFGAGLHDYLSYETITIKNNSVSVIGLNLNFNAFEFSKNLLKEYDSIIIKEIKDMLELTRLD